MYDMEKSLRNPITVHRIAHLTGNLINDNSDQRDRLGYHVYAETLATSLHHTPAPITVGIFGAWGIGKSFVAKRVQDSLKKMERRDNICEETGTSTSGKRIKSLMKFILSFVVFCILFSTMVIIIFDLATNHSSNPLQRTNSTVQASPRPMEALSWTLLSLSCLVLVVTSVLVLSNSSTKGSRKFQSYWTLLLYTVFTKIPLKRALNPDENIAGRKHETIYQETNDDDYNGGGPESRNKLKTKYIFVDFNAWQYVGSDMLWAGIILNIAEAVEKEIGKVCVRLFRVLQEGNESLDDESCDTAPSNGFYLSTAKYMPTEQRIRSLLKHFGVVTELVKKDNRWYIKFDDPTDESTAYHNLKNSGFNVSNTADKCNVQYETSSFLAQNVDRPAESAPSTQLDTKYGKDVRIVGGYTTGKVPPSSHDKNDKGFCNYMWANPRRVWCGCHYLCCVVFFVLSFIVSLAGSIVMMATSFGKNLKAQDEGDLSAGKTVIAVLPPALLGAYVIISFAWSMFNSQIRRISVAVDGAKGSITAGLGLMNTIKQEVAILSKLMNVIRFTHNIEYKIVITVDDLDRCPLRMVRKVLEAISVLLSDEKSPFVCLVVANPRVVSKCIEGGMEEALVKANITGHEYIKKIINLPFCIPSVGNLKRFCEGAHDQSDGAYLQAKGSGEGAVGGISCREQDQIDFLDTGEETEPIKSPDMDDFKFFPKRKGNPISFKEFKIRCRKLLEGKDDESESIHQYIVSNPRNVKRIMNVLLVTIRLLETTRERASFIATLSSGTIDGTGHGIQKLGSPEKSTSLDSVAEFGELDVDATDLVKWIILTDQWPFLMSCVLYHMQDIQVYQKGYRRAEADNCSLLTIYEHLENKLEEFRKHCALSSLDCNPKLLKKFLEECSSLNVARVKTLLRFTVNLDPSIKQELSSHFN